MDLGCKIPVIHLNILMMFLTLLNNYEHAFFSSFIPYSDSYWDKCFRSPGLLRSCMRITNMLFIL